MTSIDYTNLEAREIRTLRNHGIETVEQIIEFVNDALESGKKFASVTKRKPRLQTVLGVSWPSLLSAIKPYRNL